MAIAGLRACRLDYRYDAASDNDEAEQIAMDLLGL
jgi:hypothetical protein